MRQEQVEYWEVRFPHLEDGDPCITIFAVLGDGQMVLRDSIHVGPFPDWESVARRVWRSLILDGKERLMQTP